MVSESEMELEHEMMLERGLEQGRVLRGKMVLERLMRLVRDKVRLRVRDLRCRMAIKLEFSIRKLMGLVIMIESM